MNKTQTKTQATKRQSMFRNGRTVSFKMENAVTVAAMKSAYSKGKPFSLWMREAAEEKMAREMAAK